MDKPLTRTEMAFILSRVINNQAPNPELDKITAMKNQIPDISTIEECYRDGVAAAYYMGLLSGVDNKGTFNGNANINRAQAAVVLCRLYATHKPVVDYWSKAPADIQAITDQDIFNAAVQTLKNQEMIRNAPENKGSWIPYYNYAVCMYKDNQKFFNVTKAMGMMSSNSMGLDAKGYIVNLDNNILGGNSL